MAKFNVIVADVPAQFKTWSGPKISQRTSGSHYSTMSWEELNLLDVKSVSANDCCLFLWCCSPLLQETMQMAKSWGFEYKTIAFVYVKRNVKSKSPAIGMGYWTRANAELVLLFTRGKPKRLSKNISQIVPEEGVIDFLLNDRFEEPDVIYADKMKHSQKPEEVQDRIEELVGGPYLELFARRHRDNWVCVGDEVTQRDIKEDLNLLRDS